MLQTKTPTRVHQPYQPSRLSQTSAFTNFTRPFAVISIVTQRSLIILGKFHALLLLASQASLHLLLQLLPGKATWMNAAALL